MPRRKEKLMPRLQDDLDNDTPVKRIYRTISSKSKEELKKFKPEVPLYTLRKEDFPGKNLQVFRQRVLRAGVTAKRRENESKEIERKVTAKLELKYQEDMEQLKRECQEKKEQLKLECQEKINAVILEKEQLKRDCQEKYDEVAEWRKKLAMEFKNERNILAQKWKELETETRFVCELLRGRKAKNKNTFGKEIDGIQNDQKPAGKINDGSSRDSSEDNEMKMESHTSTVPNQDTSMDANNFDCSEESLLPTSLQSNCNSDDDMDIGEESLGNFEVLDKYLHGQDVSDTNVDNSLINPTSNLEFENESENQNVSEVVSAPLLPHSGNEAAVFFSTLGNGNMNGIFGLNDDMEPNFNNHDSHDSWRLEFADDVGLPEKSEDLTDYSQ